MCRRSSPPPILPDREHEPADPGARASLPGQTAGAPVGIGDACTEQDPPLTGDLEQLGVDSLGRRPAVEVEYVGAYRCHAGSMARRRSAVIFRCSAQALANSTAGGLPIRETARTDQEYVVEVTIVLGVQIRKLATFGVLRVLHPGLLGAAALVLGSRLADPRVRCEGLAPIVVSELVERPL
jgi:hypothetical protein